jgi:hypothetical protein
VAVQHCKLDPRAVGIPDLGFFRHSQLYRRLRSFEQLDSDDKRNARQCWQLGRKQSIPNFGRQQHTAVRLSYVDRRGPVNTNVRRKREKMKLLLTALWLGTLAVMLCVAQSDAVNPDQPFTIIIGSRNPSPTTTQSVEINIRLANTSNHPINASQVWASGCGVDQSYTYDIRDANGRPAEILPEIKATKEREGRIRRTVIIGTLNPGEAVETTADLRRCYDMTAPGEYSIQLSRAIAEDPKHTAIKSNKITVTVVSAEGQQ